jgi:hypothetical protein
MAVNKFDNSMLDAGTIGTTANKLLQLDGSAKIPAVDGTLLTNIPPSFTKSASDPVITTNPSGGVGTLWANTTSGEVYCCTDATAGANVWTNIGAGSGNVQLLWYGGRGLWAGGHTGGYKDTVDYITIATPGNATDFGNLSAQVEGLAGVSNGSRGIIAGGEPIVNHAQMDYYTISTPGNASDFGDISASRYGLGGCANGIRGIFTGGVGSVTGDSPGGYYDTIDYVTIATLGNAVDFGDRTLHNYHVGSCSDGSRGVTGGGTTASVRVNVIDYVTIATTSDATDFGDLSAIRSHPGAAASETRGIFGGGKEGSNPGVNTMEYITIATTGNTTDFGDLTQARKNVSATSNITRGVWGAGDSSDTIDYVEIATLGNATDFGNLTEARQWCGTTSGD